MSKKLPKFYFKKLISLSLVIVFFTPLAGCGPEQTKPLRIGTNTWLGYEPLYIAKEKNFFDTRHIKLIEFTSNSESISAFRNKAIDAACLTFDEVLLLLQSELKLKIILVMDISNGADVILAKPEFKELGQLKGKRIGVESTAVGAYMLSRALQAHNISSQDIEIVRLDINEHETAYLSNTIDAVVTFEPVSSKLQAQGAVTLFDSAMIPGEIIDVLVVQSDYLENNRSVINNLIEGWYKALAYLENNPMESANIMTKRLGISPQEIIDSLHQVDFPARETNLRMIKGENASILQTGLKLKQIMLEEKLLHQQQIDISSILDN